MIIYDYIPDSMDGYFLNLFVAFNPILTKEKSVSKNWEGMSPHHNQLQLQRDRIFFLPRFYRHLFSVQNWRVFI